MRNPKAGVESRALETESPFRNLAASNNDVRALVRARLADEGPPEVPLTRGWRAAHLLPRLTAVLQGEVLVRVADLKAAAPLDYADAPPAAV